METLDDRRAKNLAKKAERRQAKIQKDQEELEALNREIEELKIKADEERVARERAEEQITRENEGNKTQDNGDQPPVPKDPLVTLTGKKRCAGCVAVKKDTCKVDMVAIQKWEADVEAGKEFQKAPDGVACDECHRRKRRCDLPLTVKLRGGRKRKMDGGETNQEVGKKKSRKDNNTSDSGRKKDDSSNLSWVTMILEVQGELLGELQASAVEQKRAADEQGRIVEALARIAERIGQTRFPTPEMSTDEGEEAEDELEHREAASGGGDWMEE